MKKIFALLFILLIVFTCSVSASAEMAVPYESYTYTYEGEPVESPHGTVPERVIYGTDYGIGALKEPNDIFVGDNGYMYIADTGNSRIVILNGNDEYVTSISSFMNEDREDALSLPGGLCVTDEYLYVADTGNKRVLEFETQSFSLNRVIPAPGEEDLPTGFNYTPASVAVNKAGKIYVLSTGSTYGILALNSNGSFESFVGAQTVVPNLIERFWRLFMTDEQKRRTVKSIPANYSNIAIDDIGFIYLTSIPADEVTAASAIAYRSTDSNYALLKKLNYNGDDILSRHGFFSPSGDVKITFDSSTDTENSEYGISYITDIALQENGSYSLGDKKRNKIFTYDENGNLLYAFGGTGYRAGQFVQISSLAYRGDKLYVLDRVTGGITVFAPTDYGRLISSAIANTADREYDAAVEDWKKVLQYNAGFDSAYIGIADSMMKSGDYKNAMEYYKMANSVENYSKAYAKYRKELLSDYVLLIPVAVIVICILISLFLKFAKKYNKEHSSVTERGKFLPTLMYSFYIIFHPMDGFWDLKNEKRGGYRAASVILAAFAVSMLARALCYGYIFNTSYGKDINVFLYIGVILLIVALWCIANWCLTSLTNGKGKLGEIFMATCYGLLPLAIMNIPAIILSNILTLNEGMFVTLFVAIGTVWSVFLLICATMSIHEYSFGKNILIILCTLLAMALIAFVGFLFVNLLGRMYTFILNLYNEITFRL